MKKPNPKYTVMRGNVYWLNYKIPAAIYKQSALTAQVIKYSLKTKSEHEAAAYAQVTTLKINEYCASASPEEISKENLIDVVTTALSSMGVIVKPIQSKPVAKKAKAPVINSTEPDSDTVTIVFERYKQEMLRAEAWRVKSQADIEAAFKTLVELVDDRPMSEFVAPVCRQYKDLLLKYPIHRFKDVRFKTMSIKAILESTIEYDTLSIVTINNQIRKLSTFFNWAVKHGYIISNPMQGMKVRQKVSAKSARLPFTDEDLVQLFNSDIYKEHKFSKDYKYWLPILALYTGARLEELCQLYLADIKLNAPVPFIDITDVREDQHLKNASSKRMIPIHPELIELGFAKWIAEKQESSNIKLFAYLVPQREKLGHKPSIWFGKHKREMGIIDRKRVFHSFRHTLVANLVKVKAPAYELKQMLGHQQGSITFDVYGSEDIDLEPISEMLNKLTYKDVLSNVKPW